MLKRVLRNILIIVLISSLCGFAMPMIVNATEADGQYSTDPDDHKKDSNEENEGGNSGSEGNSGDNTGESQGSGDEGNEGSGNTENPGGNTGGDNTQSGNQGDGNNPNQNTENPGSGDQNTENNNQTGDDDNQNSESSGGNSQGGESQSGENTNTGTGSNNSGSGNTGSGNNSGNSGSTQNRPTSSRPTSTSTKSNDANLRDLKVDAEGMTPEFSRNVTEYYLIVDLSVEKVKVTATPADSKATVQVTGNDKLEEGENTIKITVTAEDGTKKEYIIHVTKTKDKEKANANLKTLNIDGYDLSPDFKPNIYNYTLALNEAIESLNVTAEAEKEKAKVKIEGNDDLKEGENLIEISVTAEDGITIVKYKVKVFIDTKVVNVVEESKLPGIILLVVLVTCVVAIIAGVIIKKRM